MTAQVADSILFEGTTSRLCVLPLEVLFRSMKDRPQFGGDFVSSSNWRGYVASWKIEKGHLWLIGLSGRLQETQADLPDTRFYGSAKNPIQNHKAIIARIESLSEISVGILGSDQSWYGSIIPDDNGFVEQELADKVSLAELFRSSAEPVLATWYSGLLRIPVGKELEYVHGGFLTAHETDLIIEIAAGVVLRQWVIDNKPGHTARKDTSDIKRKSMLAMEPYLVPGRESEYRDEIKMPLEARQKSSKRGANLLHESIHYFLRSHFFRQAAGSAVMSNADQNARASFDKAIIEMNEAGMALGETIRLRDDLTHHAADLCQMPLSDFAEIILMRTQYCEHASELMFRLHMPSEEKEQMEWATTNIRSAERLIAEGQFELLGVAKSIIDEAVK